MILGRIDQPETYTYLPAPFQRSLTFLSEMDLATVATGRYEIDGDKLFVIVMDMETAPVSEKLPEAHQEYIDIQLLISGEERIGVALRHDENPIAKAYDAERDICFFSSVDGEHDFILTPGKFAVFFTGQPHRPGCCVDAPMSIKKAVVKIHKSLLA